MKPLFTPHPPRALAGLLALGWLALLGAGCAVCDKDNRLLLNTLDKKIQPQSTGAKIALAPVMIPAGTLALATDAVLIHPARVVPEAWDDIYELYWKPREMDPLRKMLIFPLSLALTPPSFAGDWAVRAIFDVE
jgi:hypothetical protein